MLNLSLKKLLFYSCLFIAFNIQTNRLFAQAGCDVASYDGGFGLKFPSDFWDVGDLSAGTYGKLYVEEGNTYQITTCADISPLSTNEFDTQISLRRDSDNAELAFNDDTPCSNIRASLVEWTATFTGEVRIALFEYVDGNCGSTGQSTGIAWRISGTSTNNQPDYAMEAINASNPVEIGVPFFINSTIVNLGAFVNQNSNLRYYFSYDQSFDELDTEVGSEETPPLDQGQTYNGGTILTLPESLGISEGTYYIIGIIDADGALDDTNRENNIGYWQMNVNFAGDPDYAIQNPSLTATTVAPGQTITANVNIKNVGTADGNTGGVKYLIYHYSANNSWDGQATDPNIGADQITNLSVGASISRTEQITIPSNAQAGTRYILFRMDAIPGEVNTSNNFVALPITVTSSPDYEPVTIGKIGSILKVGSPYRYATVTENKGGTASKNVKGRIYLSSDGNLDNSDVAVGQETISPIAANQQRNGNIDIVVPASSVPSTPGKYDYNFIYKVDADNELVESDETNNVYPNDRNTVYVTSTQTTEYMVESNWIEVRDINNGYAFGQITAGQPFNMKMEVFNIGKKPNKNTSGKIYLSSDATWDAGDHYVGAHNISPIDNLTSKNLDDNFTTPNSLLSLAAGTYNWYLIYRVNENNTDWTELNTSDNETARQITLEVPLIIRPDYIPTTLSIDPQYLPLGYWRGYVILENVSAISAPTTIGNFYFSSDENLDEDDRLVETLSFDEFEAYEAQNKNFDIEIPEDLLTQTGFLIFKADPSNEIIESDEENNDLPLQIPATPKPNIEMTIGGDGIIDLGQNYPGAGIVTNEGATTNKSFTISYFIRSPSDPSINVPLKGYTLSGMLTNEERKDFDIYFRPDLRNILNLQPGLNTGYTLVGVADLNGELDESNERDNEEAKALYIYVPVNLGSPDYALQSFSANNPFYAAGTRVAYEAKVKNIGTGDVAGMEIDGACYYSHDAIFDPAVDYIVSLEKIKPLSVMEDTTYRVSHQYVTLPNNAVAGTRYLFYVVDPRKNLTESNESNNIKRITINLLESIDAPDYRPREAEIDPSYLPLGWNGVITISNFSTIAAPISVGHVYFSEDENYDQNDRFIGEFPIAAIEPNEDVTTPFNFEVPNELIDASGNLLFIIDPSNEVAELDEENNIALLSLGNQQALDWTVKQTGTNHTVIIPSLISVQIDTNHMTAGDIIGAFYTDGNEIRCAGKTTWNGENTAITIFGDEASTPEKDGFDIGEVFQWRIWKAEAQTEHTLYAKYEPVGGMITHTNAFSFDGISQLRELSDTEDQQPMQIITLQKGWNMISTYIESENLDMSAIFQHISRNTALVKNNQGDVYLPEFGINAIGAWNTAEGYKVFMNEASELEIIGARINPATPIELKQGWNIMAYLNDQPQSPERALASIIRDIELVKDNAGNIYLPALGINNIGELKPGQGYQIMMRNDAVLVYTARLAGMESAFRSTQVNQHFVHNIHSGSNASLVLEVNDLLEIGDEVGVFSLDGKLVGSLVYEGHILAFPIWGDDPNTLEIEGLKDGEHFELRVWKSKENREIMTQLNLAQGNDTFVNNGILYGTLQRTTNLENIVLGETSMKVYPNPAINHINIEFSLIEAAEISASIYNMQGQLVLNIPYQKYGQGTSEVQVDLSQLSEGIYHLHLKGKESLAQAKLVVKR